MGSNMFLFDLSCVKHKTVLEINFSSRCDFINMMSTIFMWRMKLVYLY